MNMIIEMALSAGQVYQLRDDNLPEHFPFVWRTFSMACVENENKFVDCLHQHSTRTLKMTDLGYRPGVK